MSEQIKHSNEYNELQKSHQIRNKGIKHKMFELKYGNTELSNVWKYK